MCFVCEKMDVSQYIATTLESLLENAFKPNYVINFKTLLLYLSNEENREMVTTMLSHSDFFTEWIIETCKFWEENENVEPPTDLACFVFELTILVSENEIRFIQLSNANAYMRLSDIFSVRKCCCNPQIKLAYVKLLESFLNQKRGVEWIRTTNSWNDILNYCLRTNGTNDLMEASYNFIYKLLESRICYDTPFCKAVVKEITKSFMPMNALQSSESSPIDEQHLKMKLTPTLQLIIAILEQYLKNECNLRRYKHIPRIFFIECNLFHIIRHYTTFLTDEELTSNFINISCLIYFITLSVNSKNYMITEHESIPILHQVFSLAEDAIINKKHFNNVAKLCYLATKYYSLIDTRLLPITEEKDTEKNPICFQNQFTMFQIMPLVEFMKEKLTMDWNLSAIDELRENHIKRCWGKLSQRTLRLLYSSLKIINETTLSYKYDIAMGSIHYIIKSSKYYEQETAILIFQNLLYIFHDSVAFAKEDDTRLELIKDESNFYFGLINAIKILIEHYDIRWSKCVMESVCVVNSILDFLLLSFWPTELTVEALKLLNLSIKKHMSPNLTLLLDRTSDSSLSQLGPLLLAKLQDNHWKICEAALQVLITISEFSRNEFLSFQTILQQEKFPLLAVKLSEQASESCVRASALKCLQQMVQCNELWCEFFDDIQLIDKILLNLNEKNETVVRLEATSLIHCLYTNHCFEDEKNAKIYEIMARTATMDLNWEVKKNALEFWENVIWDCLKHQGMIDGKFPEITFSKERKKIIVLNDDEIRKRLNKVLNELKSNGCLDVLIKLIESDPDIEVVEKAVQIAKRFAELLIKYKVFQQSVDQHFTYKEFFQLINQDLDEVLKNRKQYLNSRISLQKLLNEAMS